MRFCDLIFYLKIMFLISNKWLMIKRPARGDTNDSIELKMR
jgi:hypothetical protein